MKCFHLIKYSFSYAIYLIPKYLAYLKIIYNNQYKFENIHKKYKNVGIKCIVINCLFSVCNVVYLKLVDRISCAYTQQLILLCLLNDSI